MMFLKIFLKYSIFKQIIVCLPSFLEQFLFHISKASSKFICDFNWTQKNVRVCREKNLPQDILTGN